MHNLHGYYINIKILFEYLCKKTFRLFGHFMIVGHLQGTVHTIQISDAKNGKLNVISAKKKNNIQLVMDLIIQGIIII